MLGLHSIFKAMLDICFYNPLFHIKVMKTFCKETEGCGLVSLLTESVDAVGCFL